VRNRTLFSEIVGQLKAIGISGNIQETSTRLSMKASRLNSMVVRLRRERAVWRIKENTLLNIQEKYPPLKRLLLPTNADLKHAKYVTTVTMKDLERTLGFSEDAEPPDNPTYVHTRLGLVRKDIAGEMVRAGKLKDTWSKAS